MTPAPDVQPPRAARQNRLECRRLGRRSCRNGATVVWFARADFS
jgi:hypothetical protein